MKISISLILALAVSPLSAGWFSLTATPRIGPAAYDQFAPSIASNGFDYLVAWTTATPTGDAVSAVRVNADGTLATDVAVPLDSNGRSVSITPGRDGYFATWLSDQGVNAAITDSYGRIEHRVTIAQDGLTAASQTLAAWNGAVHFLVAGFAGPFLGTLLDNNANVIRSGIPLGDTHGDLTRVALTVDDSGFLLLSTKGNAYGGDDLYGRRISSSGVAGEWFLVRSMATKVLGLAATSTGVRDVIAWGDAFGVWTTTVDAQSNAVSMSRQLVPDSAAVTDVLVDGGRTWIAYQVIPSGWQAYAITLNADGSLTAPVPLPSGAKLTSNGSRILSASAARGALDTDIVGAFLTPIQVDPSFVVSKSETEQRHGTLSGVGNNVVAVWDEAISGTHQIFAARFDAKALDPSGVQISSTGDNENPDVAFNGQTSLIVWNRGEEIVARRFSFDGRVLDSDDIILAHDGYYSPKAVWDGSNWFVVWIRVLRQPACGNVGSATRVYGAHVSPAGIVLEPGGVPIDPHPSMDQVDVSLDWSGSEYIIAWTNLCIHHHAPAETGIGFAAATPDLSRVHVANISSEGQTPKVAASPDHSLIAWTLNGATTPPRRNLRGGELSPSLIAWQPFPGHLSRSVAIASLLGW